MLQSGTPPAMCLRRIDHSTLIEAVNKDQRTRVSGSRKLRRGPTNGAREIGQRSKTVNANARKRAGSAKH